MRVSQRKQAKPIPPQNQPSASQTEMKFMVSVTESDPGQRTTNTSAQTTRPSEADWHNWRPPTEKELVRSRLPQFWSFTFLETGHFSCSIWSCKPTSR
jgi:hypothetical protein